MTSTDCRQRTQEGGEQPSSAWPGLRAGDGDLVSISLAIGVSGASVSCVEQADNSLLGGVHTLF